MVGNKNLPVILTGDLNLTPDEDPISLLKKSLKDARDISQEPPYGPVGTYNGFKLDADLSERRIDYIFVQGNIKVLEYAALTDTYNNRYPSDHLPVFARIQLN